MNLKSISVSVKFLHLVAKIQKKTRTLKLPLPPLPLIEGLILCTVAPWLASIPFLFQARPVAKQDWKLFTWTVNILRLQDWEWGDQVSFKIYPNLLVQIVYLVFYIYWLIEVESNICSHKKVHTEHKTQIANKQKKLQSWGEVNVYIIIIT